MVTEFELVDGLRPLYPELKDYWGASGDYLTGARFQQLVEIVKPNTTLFEIAQAWKRRGLSGDFKTETRLNREQVSVLIDEILAPFSKEVNWNGDFM